MVNQSQKEDPRFWDKWEKSGASKRDCPDCGVKPGQPHKESCDIEPCSVCGGQFLMCNCEGHDKKFAKWNGFWPGKREAAGRGIDLNTFYEKGLNKKHFIKPKDQTQGGINESGS